MTIRTQAYLQGYLGEKTAGKSELVQSLENELADKFHREQGKPGAQSFQQYIEQAGTHPLRLQLELAKKKREDALKGIFDDTLAVPAIQLTRTGKR